MINRLFNSQTKTITGGALILAISALISRLLGIVREWLLASKFGAGPELDIYFTAFRIPDLIYNVLIAGGIVVAFLPLFSEYFSKDEKEAWQFATNLLNVLLIFLILISLLLFIFTPALLKLIAPGFSPEAQARCISLTRLMLLSPILFGLSSIFSGILQYFNRFLVYGLALILYNLGIILGIWFLSPYFGILGVCLGVILGALFHFLIQVPSGINCGFSYKPILKFQDPRIKRVFVLMFPRVFGIAAHQINLMVITAIASTLTLGSITVFNFANNIQSLPIGIIGISFAIAAFPKFTKFQAEAKNGELIARFRSIFLKILYLIIPTSFLVFILRNQIVNLILRHGRFSQLSAQLTAASLGLFCFGLWASTLIPLTLRAFFALQDTKTPTLIAIFTVVLNIILSIALVSFLKEPTLFQAALLKTFKLEAIEGFEVLGLPLAFSLSSIFQFILLLIFLLKKINEKH